MDCLSTDALRLIAAKKQTEALSLLAVHLGYSI